MRWLRQQNQTSCIVLCEKVLIERERFFRVFMADEIHNKHFSAAHLGQSHKLSCFTVCVMKYLSRDGNLSKDKVIYVCMLHSRNVRKLESFYQKVNV